MPDINFFNEEVNFTLRQKNAVRTWIAEAVEAEGAEHGPLNFVFCSNAFLSNMNVKYLNHSTLTDIITFDLSDEEGSISGDIFISVEMARENAGEFKSSIQEEVRRLIIHGVLHLIGYKDKTSADKAVMTEREDHYLSIFPNNQ